MTVQQINERITRARKQGYRLGLKTSHAMLRKAKNYQAQRAKSKNGAADADLKAESEFTAGVLHELCLRLQENIREAT
jgi:hypothetical protein